ncbi:hypothetical protein L579_1916 [Pantoea sp. AS-PWVM4]|nr:hypothetical protein L579_1916 [Pantoea sp. AS-PWVM4]
MDHVLNLLTDRRQILAGENLCFCRILVHQILMRQKLMHRILTRQILMCQILMRQILTGEAQQLRAAS